MVACSKQRNYVYRKHPALPLAADRSNHWFACVKPMEREVKVFKQRIRGAHTERVKRKRIFSELCYSVQISHIIAGDEKLDIFMKGEE